jgi:glutamate racemase
MDARPIGVFDSGVGGLTAVKELKALLPGEDLVYFGDTARVPYGTRSDETVIRYTEQCIRFLLSRDVKMIVVACGTASAVALPRMADRLPVPAMGVVASGAAAAVAATRSKHIGVIGTAAAIRSKAYERAIHGRDDSIRVSAKACPLFVPLAEEGWGDSEVARLTAEAYLETLKENQPDVLVLGCTHYPLLEGTIREVMGPGVTLINPAVQTALDVKKALEERDGLAGKDSGGEALYYVSDTGEGFRRIAELCLGEDVRVQSSVDIESY